MLSTGIAPADLDGVRMRIVDMWADAPGGWVFEWSRLARRYAESGQPDLAAVAFGWAKFPTLATPAMRTALENQLEQYLRAAPDFPAGLRKVAQGDAYAPSCSSFTVFRSISCI